MTKNKPEDLCPACKEFDYDMNQKGGVSYDIFVECHHEYPIVTVEMSDFEKASTIGTICNLDKIVKEDK
jgi:hypothetical protein